MLCSRLLLFKTVVKKRSVIALFWDNSQSQKLLFFLFSFFFFFFAWALRTCFYVCSACDIVQIVFCAIKNGLFFHLFFSFLSFSNAEEMNVIEWREEPQRMATYTKIKCLWPCTRALDNSDSSLNRKTLIVCWCKSEIVRIRSLLWDSLHLSS